MKPLKDLVLIEVEQEKPVEKGGILFAMPQWAKPQNVATILEVGADVKAVKKGQRCLFQPYAVTDTEDKTIKLIKEKDILCLIKATK